VPGGKIATLHARKNPAGIGQRLPWRCQQGGDINSSMLHCEPPHLTPTPVCCPGCAPLSTSVRPASQGKVILLKIQARYLSCQSDLKLGSDNVLFTEIDLLRNNYQLKASSTNTTPLLDAPFETSHTIALTSSAIPSGPLTTNATWPPSSLRASSATIISLKSSRSPTL
jgi:hypothetical protein